MTAAGGAITPTDTVVLRHRDLEQIANAALRMGRLLMECGGRVRTVHEGVRLVASGLGVESEKVVHPN